jgi:hypothetical protein
MEAYSTKAVASMTQAEINDEKLLDAFFEQLCEIGKWHTFWTSEAPKELIINPDIIQKLSRLDGFYQRQELRAEVTASAPVVRYFNLDFGIVTIIDDWDEKYLHFE